MLSESTSIDFMAIFSTAMTLILVIAIFVGAYFVSKMVGNTYQKNTFYGKSIVEIIERKQLSRDQALIVVKVSDKIILLGATAHQIDEIATFNSDEFEQVEIEQTQVDFKENLKEALGKYVNVKKK